MKNIFIFFSLLLLVGPRLYSQSTGKRFKYYRVDQVKTIKGEILYIKKEKCYKKSFFMVIYMEAQRGGKVYRVEVSPDWFYHLELMKGSRIEVTGSLPKLKEEHLVIARSITFQGESYYFRDKFGFPLWRGQRKKMKQGGEGRQKRKGYR